MVLQTFSDSDHYTALCRENSMIKSVGRNLTNLINGSVYGLMKEKWTIYEVKNFGEMLLYLTLKQSILELPSIYYKDDLKPNKPKQIKMSSVSTSASYGIEPYELEGILGCFLDL